MCYETYIKVKINKRFSLWFNGSVVKASLQGGDMMRLLDAGYFLDLFGLKMMYEFRQ